MRRRKFAKGLTLTETLVSVLIFAMAILGFSLLVSRAFSVNSFAIEMGIASRVASRGVEEVVKNIRRARSGDNGAFAIVTAQDNEFSFYANYDDDEATELVRYYLDGSDDTFNVGVTKPDISVTPPTYDQGNDEAVTRIANYVVNNSTSEPIFEYYDNTGAALVTPASPADVSMVKVLMFVNIDQIKAPNNIRIQSQVVIRNLSAFGDAPT